MRPLGGRTTDAAGVLVGDGVSSPVDAVPFGLAIRAVPPGSTLLWHDVAVRDGTLVVAIGHCADPRASAAARAQVSAALKGGADPVAALTGLAGEGATAVCATIDRTAATLTFSAFGDVVVAVAAPDVVRRVLSHAPGRLVSASIPPGASVLLCSGGAAEVATALAETACTTAHPETAIDRVLHTVTPPSNPGLIVLLYRQPPAPLDVTLAADPQNLAVLRARLRPWLTLAGVDAEPAADVLLAIGEAASNATEHAPLGAGRPVDLTVKAWLTGEQLRMTVTDTGVWKPVSGSPGHRGHGIPLINALVDTAKLSTTDDGTTVEMCKELHR